MTASKYIWLKKNLIYYGYKKEIRWQRDIQPCDNAETFRDEAIWVILNSGMKEQIARLIYSRIKTALLEGRDISTAFGHKGKVAAIKYLLSDYKMLFSEYLQATDKIAYLETIPFIGGITKYHIAKNLGHNCVKPDRHLVRIANNYGFENCNDLCDKLNKETGDKISMIDIVLWRSANLGWI